MLATPSSAYNNTLTIKKPVNSTTLYTNSTPENKKVTRLPDNIDHLPVKIKKIHNISQDFIEISEYCDNMIEYNNHIIKNFYVPD